MPILKKETDLYPEDLFDSGKAEAGDWWALYTIANREKKLMRQLIELGCSFYSPVIARRHRSPAGRVRTTYDLLFKNYVFLCGDDKDRYQAVCTGNVSQHILIEQQPELIADLKQIRQLIAEEAPLSPESRLEPGQRVRVRTGVFAGYEGVIVQRNKSVRLQVYVRFMEQGVSVELDDCQADPI